MFLERISNSIKYFNIIVTALLFLLSTSVFADGGQTITIASVKVPLQIKKELSPYQYILAQSGKQFLWFDSSGLSLSGFTLYRLLADLGWIDTIMVHNLTPDNYRQRDRELTRGFLDLIRISAIEPQLSLLTVEAVLIDAISRDSTEQLLLSLIPEYQQVTLLRKAIYRYRMLSRYAWPVLDPDFKPKLGQSDPRVKAIKWILIHLGDLPVKAQSHSRLLVFDAVVVAALKKFQQRHGLLNDGKLGPKTYAALQVSPERRIKQLQVNLWRWFKLPSRPSGNYVLVNIPSYQLSVIEAGQPVLEMKVIVGASDNPTPRLITQIESLTLNPSWRPTFNIIKKELIPQYQQDYLSLKRSNFQLIKSVGDNIKRKEIDTPKLNLLKLLQSYQLVQAPGSNNALGAYRFNIPNSSFIYLHDTPVKSLFKRPMRALSHGCIRLENAPLLANYLYRVVKFHNEVQMHSALKSGESSNLYLVQPLPVYITYQTAWFNKQGLLHWSDDIYSLDKLNVSLAQFQAIVSNSVIPHPADPL